MTWSISSILTRKSYPKLKKVFVKLVLRISLPLTLTLTRLILWILGSSTSCEINTLRLPELKPKFIILGECALLFKAKFNVVKSKIIEIEARYIRHFLFISNQISQFKVIIGK